MNRRQFCAPMVAGAGALVLPRFGRASANEPRVDGRRLNAHLGALAEFAIPATTSEDYDRAVGEGISDHVEGPSKAGGGAGV